MITLTNDDSDKIIKCLRKQLEVLHENMEHIKEVREAYFSHTNPMIEMFVDSKFPTDEEKENFKNLNVIWFQRDIEKFEKEIKEIEQYILLLTTGSEEE